jgi:hypothetical protein
MKTIDSEKILNKCEKKHFIKFYKNTIKLLDTKKVTNIFCYRCNCSKPKEGWEHVENNKYFCSSKCYYY